MSRASDRVKAKIERYGEKIKFTKLGGVGAIFWLMGVFQPLDTGTMNTYLDNTEVLGVARPGIKAVFDATQTAIAAADTFVRDGRTFEVLKVFYQRVSNEIVGISVVAA